MSAAPELDRATDGSTAVPACRDAGPADTAPARTAARATGGDVPAEPLPCPLCEYDLRGSPEPRCPECGYRFTPGELNDPARRFHPYLFEHHPERVPWSFARTFLGGLRPRRFWSTLHPTQPSRAGRLLLYWLACAAPLVALLAWHAWLHADGLFIHLRRFRMMSNYARVVSDPARFVRMVGDYDIRGGGYGLITLFTLAWPWLTLAALLVFQISLRRKRLRSTHVLRCVVYSADVSLWLVVPLAFLVGTAWFANGWPPRAYFPDATAVLPWLVAALLVYRLCVAYQLYLRFDHALATVLASQTIVFLVYWKVWLLAGGY